MDNMTIFDMLYPAFKIDRPIRLIELFAGVGSQAMALRDLGADFEHYRVVEYDKYAIASYNAIHDTNFPTMDITQVKGEDLGIVDTDQYIYIMTYSFPCQDLSVAGKMKGMAKGSGTRSGLLWEVERLLGEVVELPQVLLMENVPQVISDANIADFHKWQEFLENKGYTNYVEVLNAKDFGVAQNRERAFMVSLLGQWNYKFPQPIPLTKTMADYLEDEVDEKYYINNEKAQTLIQGLIDNGTLKPHQYPRPGTGSFALNCREFRTTGFKEILPSLRARDYKDPSVACTNEIIEVGKINSSQDGVVCSVDEISKTLTSGHNNQPKVLINERSD